MLFLCLDAVPVVSIRNSPHAEMAPVPRDLKLHPVDDMVRRLNRLCWIVNKPKTTGTLIQLGIQLGGDGVGEIKDNLFLNQVPHNRYVRQYFYDMAADAALEAVLLCSQGQISNRMNLVSMFPEMNPAMDSYRYVQKECFKFDKSDDSQRRNCSQDWNNIRTRKVYYFPFGRAESACPCMRSGTNNL